MTTPYYRVNAHWAESRALARDAVIYSEMPPGDSPVSLGTRSINFVIDGYERYEIDGRSHLIGAGEFLFLDAGVSSRVACAPNQVTRGLCIYLPTSPNSPALSISEATSDDPLAARSFHFPANTHYGRLLTGIGRRLAAEPDMAPEVAAWLVTQTVAEFALLRSELSVEMMRIDAAKPATRRDILQRLHKARALLHDQVHAPVPLDRLATLTGMSQFHLARTFCAVFGVPPAQYHAELRLRLADEALRTGRMSIAETAAAFGYAEPSSFARAFTRAAGITPGQAVRGAPAAFARRDDPTRR